MNYNVTSRILAKNLSKARRIYMLNKKTENIKDIEKRAAETGFARKLVNFYNRHKG
jgi:hypothetical protein